MSKTKKPASPAALTADQLKARNAAALARVEAMDDPDKLRNLMSNADRMGVPEVRDAAFRRLALVQTEGEPGTIEHDVLQTIFAYEQLVREELGKPKRLTKSRMKLTKTGPIKTLEAFAAVTDEYAAFETLKARGLDDMTSEAVILRHPDEFDAATRDAATARLAAAPAESPEPVDTDA